MVTLNECLFFFFLLSPVRSQSNVVSPLEVNGVMGERKKERREAAEHSNCIYRRYLGKTPHCVSSIGPRHPFLSTYGTYGSMKTGLLLFALLAPFALAQEYDLPSPYVQRPVEYSGYFQSLHDELDQPLNGVVRTYYIAADEIVWDYAAHLNRNASHTASDFWTAQSKAISEKKRRTALAYTRAV